jgi:hypothetical protein
MNMKRLRLALKQGGNPEYPTGTGSSVNLVYGLNPRQVETTSAGDAPQVSPTRECFARGIKTLYEMRGTESPRQVRRLDFLSHPASARPGLCRQ